MTVPDETVAPGTTEIRLALVLNGGVSLAVWMGGVTHELALLRRACADAPPPDDLPEPERRVLALWRRLVTAARARVVIDTVAGTSAGGLNGLLLATALARGSPLPALRQVWEESAALESLLTPTPTAGVLDGDFFRARIEEVLRRIPEQEGGGTEPVSLFMTATALDGRPRVYTDSFAGRFEVPDHRRVYHFQHDRDAEVYRRRPDGTWDFADGRREDLSPAHNEALAQAARASASFPVAFPPVSEVPMVPFRTRPDPAWDAPASCVIDGGVLNNAPFGPVLESIARRRVDRPVERVVVYVVPSVGRLGGAGPTATACESVPFLTAAASALRYPREADFRSGTEELSARLGTGLRDSQQELFGRLHGPEDTAAGGASPMRGEALRRAVRASAESLLDEYRLNRGAAILWQVRRRLAGARTVTPLVATPQARPETVAALLADTPAWSPPSDGAHPLTAPDLRRWTWGLVPAQRLCELLGGRLHQCLRQEEGRRSEAARRHLGDGAAEVSRQLRRVLAVTDAVEARLRSRHPADARLTDREAATLLHRVFEELSVPERVGDIVTTASARYVAALRRAEVAWAAGLDPEAVVRDCLSIEVLTGAFAPASQLVEPPTPPFRFLRLGPDTMSRLFHEDRFTELGGRKLYGTRFGHFGAFVDRRWRASDFTWGRLDAAHHLLSLLVTDPEDRRRAECELHQAILEAEAPDPARARQWMADHLTALQGSDRRLLAATDRGTLARAAGTVRDMLLHPSTASVQGGAPAAVGRVWGRLQRYLRPALDPARMRPGDRRWVRWLTAYARHRVRAAQATAWRPGGAGLRGVLTACRVAAVRTGVAVLVLLVAVGLVVGLLVGGCAAG